MTRCSESPNRNQQASRHARFPRIFSIFASFLRNLSSNFNLLQPSCRNLSPNVSFHFIFRKFSRIFFGFAVQTLHVLNHGTLHMLTIWLVVYVLFSVPMLLLLSPSSHAIYRVRIPQCNVCRILAFLLNLKQCDRLIPKAFALITI